jgi:hypothetical protein
MSEFQETKNNLILRVKRKRTQDPSEYILCIAEDNDSRNQVKKSAIQQLVSDMTLSHNQTDNNSMERNSDHKLLLSRKHTVEGDNSNIDQQTFESLKRSRDVIDNYGDGEPSKNEKFLWITKGRKTIVNDKAESFVIVDMDVVKSTTESVKQSPSPKKGNKIINPITRQLDEAINVALNTGDFSAMYSLLEQGADVNYQRTAPGDGMTCLMAAVIKEHLRMVTYLLARKANPLLLNSEFRSASDYSEYALMEKKGNDTVSKIAILIRQAVVSFEYENSYQEEKKRSSKDNSMDEDYVYDIYCADGTLMDTEGKMPSVDAPEVHVSGLRIDADGTVEMIFHYDSDWSDLGDDEDPDSNDERNEDNDYPDEEEEENDEQDSDEENVINSKSQFRKNNQHDEEYDFDNDDDDDNQLPKFERNSVGRVLHPMIVDDPFASIPSLDGGIEEMWNLGNEAQGNADDIVRRNDMAKKTGMNIGAIAREFDSNGLAKFGNDLSDDDTTENWMNYSNEGYNPRDEYNEYAYNSDDDSL